jgi:hypothetical protein
MVGQPREHLRAVAIGREDGIEDVLDVAVAHHEREPAVEASSVGLERRKVERVGQGQPLVAQQRERQMQPATASRWSAVDWLESPWIAAAPAARNSA